jgi:hypothetical protein
MGRQSRFRGRLIQGLSEAVVDEDEVTNKLPHVPIWQHSWALESIRWQGTQPGLNRSRLLQQGVLWLRPWCCHSARPPQRRYQSGQRGDEDASCGLSLSKGIIWRQLPWVQREQKK